MSLDKSNINMFKLSGNLIIFHEEKKMQIKYNSMIRKFFKQLKVSDILVFCGTFISLRSIKK